MMKNGRFLTSEGKTRFILTNKDVHQLFMGLDDGTYLTWAKKVIDEFSKMLFTEEGYRVKPRTVVTLEKMFLVYNISIPMKNMKILGELGAEQQSPNLSDLDVTAKEHEDMDFLLYHNIILGMKCEPDCDLCISVDQLVQETKTQTRATARQSDHYIFF